MVDLQEKHPMDLRMMRAERKKRSCVNKSNDLKSSDWAKSRKGFHSEIQLFLSLASKFCCSLCVIFESEIIFVENINKSRPTHARALYHFDPHENCWIFNTMYKGSIFNPSPHHSGILKLLFQAKTSAHSSSPRQRPDCESSDRAVKRRNKSIHIALSM